MLLSFRKTKDFDSILRHHLMKISFYEEEKKKCEEKKKGKITNKKTHTDLFDEIKEKKP